MKYSDDELALLSDEERSALVADQPNVDALKSIAGDDADSDNGDEVDGKADDKGGDADGITAKADEAEASEDDANGEAVADEAEDEDSGFTPKLHVQDVEKFDETIEKITSQKTDLASKFEAGDITLSEFMSQRDALSAQESDLKVQRATAEFAQSQNASAATQRWEWDQEQFLDDHKEYTEDPILFAALNASVMALGTAPENSNRSGRWFLNQAHKQVSELFVSKSEAPPAKPETPTAKPGSRKPDLSMVPKTLAHLPAADIPQTGSVDEFAHIDRLSGLEYEQAVSKLSEAERERFRRSA